jgi:uncharacterized protein YjbI with pentapeptide repeats
LLPANGRGIDLSGEKLVAQEPSEAIFSALIAAHGAEPSMTGTTWPIQVRDQTDRTWLTEVREQAWNGFGRGIDLSGWRFPWGSFDRATMAHIQMSRVDLQVASLDYANLFRANLDHAHMEKTSLRHSDLTQASLVEAHIRGASFAGASLRSAKLSRVHGESQPTFVAQDLQSATQKQSENSNQPDNKDSKERLDMTNVDLTNAQLDGANLSNAVLKGAILNGANLAGTKFCGADLRKADLANAVNVRSAIFTGADLAGAKLPADMIDGKLRNANLFGIKIVGALQDRRWKQMIGSNVRNIDSLPIESAIDASLPIAVLKVDQVGKMPEPCAEPPATLPKR